MADIHPTAEEEQFLKLGYNRFLDIFEKIMADDFWKMAPEQRLFLIKELCSVYVEVIKYPPLNSVISESRRLNAKLVGADLIKMLRNLLLHFPFFETWDDIVFDKSLITSIENAGTIDRFLSKSHPQDIKYRFWEADKKKMTYVEVKLNTNYSAGKTIKLSDILPEKEGMKFLSIFMKGVLMTQVEELGKPD